MRLYQKFKNLFCHKIYQSIDDMPIYNWVEFHKTANPKYLVQEKKYFYPLNTSKQWENLCSDFYLRFGKTKELIKHLEKLKKMTVLMCENAIKFDTIKKIELDILENELKEDDKKQEVIDFYVNNSALSKAMGYNLDPKKTSVSEYYGNIRLIEKQAALNSKQNGNK